MTEHEFWNLIQEAKTNAASTAAIPEYLVAALSNFETNEIWDFAAWEAMFFDAANDERLWAAASLVCSGLSDDGFDYFKGWLVAQGESVFRAVLANPDYMAELDYKDTGFFGPRIELEGMLGVATEAYNQKLQRPPHLKMNRPPNYQPPPGCHPERTPRKNLGFLKLVQDKTGLATHFPNIVKRFCEARKDSQT